MRAGRQEGSRPLTRQGRAGSTTWLRSCSLISASSASEPCSSLKSHSAWVIGNAHRNRHSVSSMTSASKRGSSTACARSSTALMSVCRRRSRRALPPSTARKPAQERGSIHRGVQSTYGFMIVFLLASAKELLRAPTCQPLAVWPAAGTGLFAVVVGPLWIGASPRGARVWCRWIGRVVCHLHAAPNRFLGRWTGCVRVPDDRSARRNGHRGSVAHRGRPPTTRWRVRPVLPVHPRRPVGPAVPLVQLEAARP